MAARSRTRGMPAAVRAQLRLQAKREEAARELAFPSVSQAARDTKAELDSLRDSAFRNTLLLRPDVETVSLRTTSEARPAAVERFYLETWPRLVYANPDVRFGVHLHYTRSSLLRLNRSLEQQARELETRIQSISETIQSLEVDRGKRKRQRAKEMGVTLTELDSIVDAEDQTLLAAMERRTGEMAELHAQALKARTRALPIETLEGTGQFDEPEQAHEKALRQAASELDGQVEIDEQSPEQVLGPLTPKAVADARRAGHAVDFPIRHCLEVMYRSRPGVQSFDLSTIEADDQSDVLQRVGLRHEASAEAAPAQAHATLPFVSPLSAATGVSPVAAA